MTLSEKEWISQLQNDSQEAFEHLYYTYSHRLYGFVYKLTKSADMAEDVVQETFIKIWETRSNILPGYSFKSYLFMIARNQVINLLRRQTLVYSLEECEKLEDNLTHSENTTDIHWLRSMN